MIVICQHTSTDTLWPSGRGGVCEPLTIPDTRTTLHADQEIAIVGGASGGFGGGFASVAGEPGLWVLLVTILTIKAVLRMVR